MRFLKLPIAGAFLVEQAQAADERGSFARLFCKAEFAAAGLVAEFEQVSLSSNRLTGTLRGMHYSVGADAETKLVRCMAGAVHDVLVDVRPGSPSFGVTVARDLAGPADVALYVPAGVAHGFQALQADSAVLYMIDRPFVAAAQRGFRWNDPIVAAAWPLAIGTMAPRDRDYPDFRP
ncbi:MAG: dTDP-4-dehydrorhamnose 3,5-epimerase family protein [Nevskia sp.]|nr:dTDP-4-dehydrorhamnose 3,5-epimerase family protein [Nevskia sp.]